MNNMVHTKTCQLACYS